MPIMVTPGQLARRADLYHNLCQLTGAGIPILQCLEKVAGTTRNPGMRFALESLRQGLVQGGTLAESLQPLGQWFSAFEMALLNAAEQSGQLPETFRQLAKHYEEKATSIRKILALVAYPALLFHVAIFIFPIKSLQALILQGEFISFLIGKLSVVVPLYAVLLALCYLGQEKRGEAWRSVWDSILHGIPVLGAARRDLALARLSAALGALIRAGVPILQAWEIAAPASGSTRFHRAVTAMQPHFQAQETPAEALARSRVFPEMFTNQYAAGELSGKLDDNLDRLYQYYLEEGNRRMQRALVVAGGLLYFGIVMMVVWQVLSFYIAYFKQIGEFIPD